MRGTTAADSAVQSWLSAEHAFAVKWSHARAHMRTAGTTGILWMLCMQCSTLPSADIFHAVQSWLSSDHATAVKWSHAPRAARACSRAHAHCWHGWEIPVRGHFSTRNSSMITSTRTHAHAHTSMVTSTRTHARAHTHHWHNWSDATIDCRCFKRLSGLVLLFVLLLQTCREAEDRC